jgi:hypothetical protein
MHKILFNFILVIFVSTLSLNIISLNYSPLLYLDIKMSNKEYKNIIPGYHTRLKGIDELKNLITVPQNNFEIEKKTSLVFESLRHGSRDLLFFENWFLWILSKIYEPLKKTQNIKKIVLSGLGTCNEASAVLNGIAKLNKVPARFIALNGHIISELKIKDKWIMADANYGIVFPFGYEKMLNENPKYVGEIIRDLLGDRGYDDATIENYKKKLLSTEDNKIFKINEALSSRLLLVENFGEIFNWFFSFLLGLTLVRLSRKKVNIAIPFKY